MALVNSNISYTGLVEKYIGSAYDTVKLVADSMEELAKIVALIENPEEYDALVKLGLYIEEYLDEIRQYQGSYFGAHPVDPTEDIYGDPPNAGDMYFNTAQNVLKVFSANNTWDVIGVIDQKAERIIFATGIANPTDIPLANSYTTGTNSISVYIDGERLFPYANYNEPTNIGEFQEISPSSIRLLTDNYITGNHRVDIYTSTEVANSIHMVDVDVFLIKGATNQSPVIPVLKTIPLPANKSYVPNTNHIEIFYGEAVNRNLQVSGLDYTETNPYSFTMVNTPDGDKDFVVKIGHITNTVPDLKQMLIQPTPPEPTDYETGRIWFNTETLRLYVLYVDTDSSQWLSVAGEETVLYPGIAPPDDVPQGTPVQHTLMQIDQPNTAGYPDGTQWFKLDTGEMYILYHDGTSSQWLKISTL